MQNGYTPRRRGYLLGTVSLAVGMLGLGALPQGAQAQTAAASSRPLELEEIVVTAEKRSENLQNVPLAVSAITSNELANRGVSSTMGLTLAVPGLTINHTANEGNIYIRGVGTSNFGANAEQTVSMYVDGVYMPSAEANIFSFNNIERIEVLKGPQGTLFGRNTTGGVIHVITKDPSHTPAADLSLDYANYDTLTASAYVTGGLTDKLAADLAVVYANQGKGWGTDLTTGAPIFLQAKDNIALRTKWLFTPSEGTSIKLGADYSRTFNNDMYQPPVGGVTVDGVGNPGRYNARSGFAEFEKVKSTGASAQIDQDAGGLKLVSITSYRRTHIDYTNDQDKTPLTVVQFRLSGTASRTWSQELRLQNSGESRLKWVLGGFYYDSRAGYPSADIFIGALGHRLFSDEQHTKSYAAFGQATAEVYDATKLTLGLRYTSEDQNFVVPRFSAFGGPVQTRDVSQSFTKLTWRAALDHEFAKGVMGYVSYNRGFKSGGYNALSPLDPPYRPEVLDAYETGLKSELLDRRLRLNAAAFYYRYTNIQVTLPVVGGSLTTNGAAAEIKGLEADFQGLVTEALTVTGGFTYLPTAKYTSYPRAPAVSASGVSSVIDAAGHRLSGAPKLSASLAATYKIDTSMGSFSPSMNLAYTDKTVFYPDNREHNPAHTVLNASVTWVPVGEKYSVRIWAKNLTDEFYLESVAESALHDVQREAPPRTYGVTITAHL